jgi:hypothetical protein
MREGSPPFAISRYWECKDPDDKPFDWFIISTIKEERGKLQGTMIVTGKYCK